MDHLTKDQSKMDQKPEKDSIKMLMVVVTQVTLKTINLMEQVLCLKKMVPHIEDNSNMDCIKVMDI